MASDEDIARLRRLTDTVSVTDPYTDELLEQMIDQLGFDPAAAAIWNEKAAAYASMVDTTESGSSRSLSQLHKMALEMASKVNPQEETPIDTGRSSFTVGIERV
jgi:hypothetical protein